MKYIFFPLTCLLSLFLFSCKKDDSKAEQNQSLLTGTWNYVSSDRSTTAYNSDGSVSAVSAFVYTPSGSARNHIIFSNNGTAFMVEDGFGFGLSGSLFADTVSYHVTDNTILLDFPAGTNYYYYPNYTYAAYQDTLSINFLSADSLSFTRKYHYKHLAAPTELKESSAQLRKQ